MTQRSKGNKEWQERHQHDNRRDPYDEERTPRRKTPEHAFRDYDQQSQLHISRRHQLEAYSEK